jgi:PQQ-dependent catabolism-associated CXXCW motif protein
MMISAVRVVVAMVALSVAAVRAAEVIEPDGYRLDEYRTTTPMSLRGAATIDTQQAEKLWRNHLAAFVDVLPRPPRPRNLPKDTLWRDKPRANIPDSTWLPDTGYGALAPSMEDYFSRGLQNASRGDRNKLLVIYCLANCWMSWNAAKRALSLGYPNVAWYREGTDGWLAAGLPTQDATPERRPAE